MFPFETIIAIAGVVLGSASQVAAIVGAPKWVKRVGLVHKVYKLLAGNYGKASNKYGG